MSDTSGKLYIVATPIGNLGDFSFRAVEILRQCDRIAAEDTRQSRRLLDYYGIHRPLVALHEHNESAASSDILQRIGNGESIALVSDAGTPLVSDPGYQLVRQASERGISVVPVPGACALIAALSAAGLATDRFIFAGFPPRGGPARKAWLESLCRQSGTLVFYESCHRIRACLTDIGNLFPGERECVIARELTKVHETIVKTTVSGLDRLIEEHPFLNRGEIVVLLQGAVAESRERIQSEHLELLDILLQECSVKTASSLASRITGVSRKQLYSAALKIKS